MFVLQFWIAFVIFLGMLEKTFYVSMYSTVNQNGDHGMEQSYLVSVQYLNFVVCIFMNIQILYMYVYA